MKIFSSIFLLGIISLAEKAINLEKKLRAEKEQKRLEELQENPEFEVAVFGELHKSTSFKYKEPPEQSIKNGDGGEIIW
jgi:hypothetical protein